MPTHPLVSQEIMPMHININPGMAQPHHMMAPGIPHMGISPNPMHHEHMSQSSMYNNSESAYHHHMQSLGCPPPPQHMTSTPQTLQQLPVQQPILPCTSDSQLVSNSVPYSDPTMPPAHIEQPIQMSPEHQQQSQPEVQPLLQPQQDQLPLQIQQPPVMPQSPVETEPQVRAESPLIEQINQSPPPQTVEQSPVHETEVIKDDNPEVESPVLSPDVEKLEPVENDNTSVGSHHSRSRSLSPAELNEPQSLERDCWSGSDHDPPPPTLTAEVSPPASPKEVDNETAETSIFNFTEDEEPPPPLHSLPERTPRKLKGLAR